MYPQTHFLFSFFLGEIFVKLGIITHKSAVIAGLLGGFIDVDHLIEFVRHHKDWNLKHVWNAAVVEHEICERTFIHHKLGFVLTTIFIVLLILINRITEVLVISFAYYSHLFLDYIPIDVRGMKKFTIRKEGFIIKLPLFEVIIDIVLLLGCFVLIFS